MPRKILIVDDIKPNRLILREILRAEYEILEAEGGEEALAVLRDEHASVSAVLLDISMPGMDGYEVLRRIREDMQLAQTPVIMITGSEGEQSRVIALANGANDYVTKPYKADIIRHCLKNHIAFHEAAERVSTLQRDKLTRLYTRETFFEKVREMVSEREPGYYVMACFDIDQFKVINDQYGTEMGDAVLQHAAQAFREGFGPRGGICSRIAADDFAVLYPRTFMDTEEIAAIRERATHVEGLPAPVTYSVGRYVAEDRTMSPAAMYDRAMLAAASVKSRFDSHVAMYDESMRARLIREQEIVADMKQALRERQFEAWFQPLYNYSTEAMIGAEALVRWRHPQKGLIAPNEFIPVFEQNGFVYELDKYVWEEVCRYLRKWTDEGRNPLPVSVNLSRHDLLHTDLVSTIHGLVSSYGLRADMLRLEVTESAFTKNPQLIIAVVKELIALGFTVEIDDFGSGYSSLNTLKDVPAQIIKLDMKFLESSDDTQRGGSIVESVIRMAKWLGMSVIAEGVETAEQADFLKSVGCSYMQGYLFARPMPAEAYEAHCKGAGKEERLLTLETVDNLDNNAFWTPESMDTMMFNSYVGAACIFEYHRGVIEVLRSTELFAEMVGGGAMSVADTLKLNWNSFLDEENGKIVAAAIRSSRETKKGATSEVVFTGLPGCPNKTYVRATFRVVATAGDRCLVYNLVENITARREAERETREAAARIQSMMDDMPGGFARMIVPEEGSIRPVYINGGLAKLLGMSHDEIMDMYGDDAFAGVHPEDVGIVEDAVARMLSGGEARSARYRLLRGGGDYCWLSIFGRVTKDAGGTFLNVYYTDASEQVKEEELQKSLLDNLPGGAGIYELRDGRMSLVYQNKSYWELVGLYEEEKFPDPNAMSAIHPDDLPVIMRELSEAIAQNRDVNCDIRLRHLTLGYRGVHLAGRIVCRETGEFLIYATFTPADRTDVAYQQTLPLLLSTIMESSNDFEFAKDRDFRYICCSPAFLSLAGLADERQAVGKTDYDIFPADMAEQFRKNDLALLESGEPMVDFEETVRSRDGTPHYCLASKHLLRDSAGECIGIYGSSHDITKEHSALERLRLVNDSIPGGIATYSVMGDEIRVVYCNDGFCRLFGGTREGLEGRADLDPMEWVFEEDRPALLAQIRDLVDNDLPMDVVFRVEVIGGGYKWINEKAVATEHRGEAVLLNAMLLDITESQSTLEMLRISEEEHNLAVQHGGNIVCRYDVEERSLTLSPRTAKEFSIAEKITGVPYEPVRLGMVAPESARVYTEFFESIIGGEKNAEATFRQKYLGEWQWTEAKSSTIFDDDGEPVKAIISFFDVTEKVERDTIFRKWQQSLKGKRPESYTLYRCNISRNSSFDTTDGSLLTIEFAEGNFDFDDRTAEYVTRCVFEEDRERFFAFLNVDALLADFYQGNRTLTIEYREKLPEGGVRWLKLTVDLIDLSYSSRVDAYMLFEDIDEAKRHELQMKELSEADPLTGILNRVAFSERVNLVLRASKPETVHALLMLDIDGFKQVNDVFGHVAGDQALVEIAEGLRATMRHDDLVARLGGDEFVIFLANILDKRAAAGKARQICALVKRSYSAEVQISASVGIAVAPLDGTDFDSLYRKADAALYFVKGTGRDSFAFYNRSMADEHLEPEPDVITPLGGKKAEKKRRMLIVDDNVIDHALLQNIFREEYIIEKAKDGNSALVRLRHYGAAISVVLLDLMMPGMDGFAVLAKMQESLELRNIPVVIVSGDESREACLEAIRRGATDFITKPVDADLLRIRVLSAVSKAENEQLRAKNSLLEVMNEERIRYDSALECTGITFVEFDWRTGEFTYYQSITKYLLGAYDDRGFWRILLSDMVADTKTVQDMQQLVHRIAEDKTLAVATMKARLKTPQRAVHNFRVTVRKVTNEFKFTSRMIIALDDIDYEV